MLVACLLQYSDTQSYGVAAIFGLIKDLKLYGLMSDFHLKLVTQMNKLWNGS
jgi:ACS family allantoate permease-like MFS transporter